MGAMLLFMLLLSGLQILTRQGQWIEVGNEQDTLIVNAGSLLQEISNHLFFSATHRVIASTGNCGPRISYAMFHNPADCASIVPTRKILMRTNEKRVGKCSTAIEYLQQKTIQIAQQKAERFNGKRMVDGRGF